MMEAKTYRPPFFDPAQRDRITYSILFVLYMVALYPILRADRPYEDDMERVLIGRIDWDSNGRPLTTLLMRALQCFEPALADISPLTQIAAMAALAWIGVLIARRFGIRSPWAAALAAFPLGAQPFFLMNLSYKFDALSMGLAVLFAALPVLSQATGGRGWWLGILWIFCSLCLYQAAINVYLLYALLDLVIRMVRQEPLAELRRRLAWWASQSLTGMLIYQLLVGTTMIDGWVAGNARKIHRLDELLRLPHNIAEFYRYIGDGFDTHWRTYFFPVLMLMAVFPLVIGIHYTWKQRKMHSIAATSALLLASLLLPALGLLGVMGPMLALVKPFLNERVMIGVGGWLSMGLVTAYVALEQWQQSPRWMLAMAWMLALGMEVIANAYGNAMREQERYESHIAGRLADDYAMLEATGRVRALLLDGSAGYAPATKPAIRQMPILGRMIYPYLTGSDSFHTPHFLAYFMPRALYIDYPDDEAKDPPRLAAIQAVLARTCTEPAWLHTRAYDMYKVDDIAVAVFRRLPAIHCDAAASIATSSGGAGVTLAGSPLRAME